MTKHLQSNKRFLPLIIALFVSFVGITSLHAQSTYPVGALPKVFSVSDSTSVFFSQGNLQYIGSAETPYWKFAEHQWDYLGTTTGQNSSDQNVDRDWFGWGTSGYNHGANCYQPWSTNQSDRSYYAYGNSSYNLYDQTGQADWGFNAISNGGNQENSGWRTLTYEEWQYLFNTRSTPSGIRYAKANVNNVNGVILLPDDWNANYYTLNSTNSSGASYTTNTITAEQWASLEQFGAVFLPAAGLRSGTSVYNVGSYGYYWSASYYDSYYAWNAYFYDSNLNVGSGSSRCYGRSVRLVFPSQGYSFAVNASPSPAEGGAVSGAGAYQAGAECTLTATPSAGYVFHNWTENGIIMSTDASYTFVVLRGRNLVANFVPIISEGGLSAFTVNADGGSVVFSQGNLQYIGSAETPYWKFAEHQWDYLGDNGQGSDSPNVDRDLFGWGTSGYNHGAVCFQPWSTSQTASDYYAYGNSSYNLFDQTGQADWGYNVISNGGNQENGGWRTLTKDEWGYLFNTRSTPSGVRYAKANVNNVNGVILLPDDWNANYYTLNSTNNSGANYTANTITATQWASLEQFGAVFLPSAGNRDGTSVSNVGSYGTYWSSSYRSVNQIWDVDFDGSKLRIDDYASGKYGRTVRLVFPSQGYSFAIGTTLSPAEGGAVSGAGTYQGGAECTLTATASAGYAIANWTENGAIVSTDATYTFVVSRDRNLVANFVAEGNIVFADDNVKAICAANWDTNGDGELSYAEAFNVTSLGNVFKNNTAIHSFNELQYFSSLGSIGEQAFWGCTELTQITIPEPVTSVGSKAFWNCPALQTVNYNAINCTSMQTSYNSNTYSVFSSNESGGTPAITRVVIGNGVQQIPDYAFKDAANIYPGLAIRSSVTTIGAHAFENCSSITTITFQNTQTLTTIGDYAFSGCTAWNKPLSLPNSLNAIGAYAFNGCSALTGNIAIPNTVTAIGEGAFSGCSGFNGTLTLPVNESVTTINQYTFNGCSGLTGTLTIPANVTEVANSAFRGCSGITGSLTLHDAITTVGSYAFYGCSNIAELTIGESVSSIGGYAFWNCLALTTVHFNATNCNQMSTQIEADLYHSVFNSYDFGLLGSYNCSSARQYGVATDGINIYHSLFNNGLGFQFAKYDMEGDLIETFNISGCGYLNDLTYDGQYFYGSDESNKLYCVDMVNKQLISSTVTGCNAILYCAYDPNRDGFWVGARDSSISLIDRSGAVVFIGPEGRGVRGATYYQDENNVEHVYLSANNLSNHAVIYDYNILNNTISLNPVFYISIDMPGADNYAGGCFIGEYHGETVFFWDNQTAPNTVGIYSLPKGSDGISTITIGEYVTRIPDYAFSNCPNAIGDLPLPAGLTYIGDYAFAGCSGFTGDLVIPNSVNTIGQYAFSGCSGFDGSLTVGRGVQTINQNTFANCSGFSGALILGTQVNNIGNNAFQNCSEFALVISENPNPIAAQSSTFTGMNYSIPVYVPDGLVSNYQNATGWNNFTNYIEQFTFWDNLDSANWSDEMNWLSMSLPTENDVVCITYNCDLDIDYDVLYVYVYNVNDVLTIKANQTLYTTYGVGLMSPSQLVIEEGGQVIYGNGANADVTQTVQLSAGWNWFSTYLSGEPTELLQMLENSLGSNGIVIKSNAVSTDYYEDYGWYGDLDDEGLKSSQMYMIKTNAACTVELEGVPANPAEVGITIRHGWNWIGFPCAEAMSVADALAGFQAEDGDILKSSGASTDYYEGFGWYGELETMEPGQGFMYYSNSLTTKTVYFQTGSAKGRRQLLNY